ncbi:MAG: hypothetical protein IJB57_02420 [Clostridia bacterium]|nr:hypothetical protein [Clostridia bacterium]
MENIFLRFLNISITAGWIVLAVVVLRLLLKKAPKWISCLLWAVVGIRLVLPFSIESIFSLIPSTTTVDPDIVYQASPSVNTGLDAVNSVVNPIITDSFAPNLGDSANPLQIWTFIAAWAWVIGIGIMLIYTIISYILLKTKVGTAVKLDENIYQSERVTSPFILGVIKPRIYLPFKISEGDIAHVIAHERAHLKRGDHLIKPIAFVLLAVYWFNPLMWVAYILLCRDIELACDEKVIRDMEHTQKQEYSKALLDLSVRRISVAACPLAFGEVGVKARIKSVMNYKKPAFWIIIVALIACVVVSVCFLTDPINGDNSYGAEAELSDLSDIDRFENVSRIKLISPTNDVTVVVEDEVAYIKEKISQLVISDKEISQSRAEDRPSEYCIMIYYDNESYVTINFNIGCREVWYNNMVKPTFSYKVDNPQVAKEIFKHIYTDPAVLQYDTVEAAILEHNENAYLKGDIGVCTYRELLTEGSDGKMKVYIQALYGEYSLNDENEVEKVSGGTSTVRITFEQVNESWSYTEYCERKKGNESEFPQSVLDAADKVDMDEMRAELDEKATRQLTSIVYHYKGESVIKNATLTLWGKDSFQFSYSMLSSNLCMGKYRIEGDKLILFEDGTDNSYTFVIQKDGESIIFDAKHSTPLPKYKYGSNAQPEVCVPDDAEFVSMTDIATNPNKLELKQTIYYAGDKPKSIEELGMRGAVILGEGNFMTLQTDVDGDGVATNLIQGHYTIEGLKLVFRTIGAGESVFDIEGDTLVYNEEESTYTRSSLRDKTAYRLWKDETVYEDAVYTLTVNGKVITDNKVYVPAGDITFALTETISENIAYKRVEGRFISPPAHESVLNVDYPHAYTCKEGATVASYEYDMKNVPAATTVSVTITKELKQWLGLGSNVIEIITEETSQMYTVEDIASAIAVIKKEFKTDWQGCTLTEIYYAGDDKSKEYQDWADRNNADEVIVLISSFYVSDECTIGSLNKDSTYSDWMWILVRNKSGQWQHVDHGY